MPRRANPKKNDLFRHFKGGMYVVHGIAEDTTNDLLMVIYSPDNDHARWFAREIGEFMGVCDDGKYRFEFVQR